MTHTLPTHQVTLYDIFLPWRTAYNISITAINYLYHSSVSYMALLPMDEFSAWACQLLSLEILWGKLQTKIFQFWMGPRGLLSKLQLNVQAVMLSGLYTCYQFLKHSVYTSFMTHTSTHSQIHTNITLQPRLLFNFKLPQQLKIYGATPNMVKHSVFFCSFFLSLFFHGKVTN